MKSGNMLSKRGPKYVGVASNFPDLATKCCASETSKLSVFVAYDVKRRTNRAEEVPQNGNTMHHTNGGALSW